MKCLLLIGLQLSFVTHCLPTSVVEFMGGIHKLQPIGAAFPPTNSKCSTIYLPTAQHSRTGASGTLVAVIDMA